jgi:hypothetical protein
VLYRLHSEKHIVTGFAFALWDPLNQESLCLRIAMVLSQSYLVLFRDRLYGGQDILELLLWTKCFVWELYGSPFLLYKAASQAWRDPESFRLEEPSIFLQVHRQGHSPSDQYPRKLLYGV